MRILIILTVLLATSGSALAQVTGYGLSTNTRRSTSPKELKEYRLKKTSGKILFTGSKVNVQGYDGNEVVIAREVEKEEVDERAAGLQSINGHGIKDNTGVGLYVGHNGDQTEFQVVNPEREDSVYVRVPRNLAVSVTSLKGIWGEGTISISDVQGEIEVSSTWGNVILDNVTGPVAIKTSNGNVEAVFRSPVKGPISLLSSFGFIDVALPVRTAANLQMGTSWGEIYASEEFNIDIQNTTQSRNGYEETGGLTFSTITSNGKKGVVINNGNHSLSTDTISLKTRDKNAVTIGTKGSAVVVGQDGKQPSVLVVNNSRNRIIGSINGGGENIDIRTANGKIYLRTTENK